MKALILTPGKVSLAQLEQIYRDQSAVALNRNSKPAIDAAAERVQQAAAGTQPVYGVNTGFGKLANIKIDAQDTAQLQHNLVLSHCCGVGEAAAESIVRLMMSLKLISLGRGASGVRWELICLLEKMLERGVIPVVPAQGSVGASGDLAPLAHMAAVMIGEGQATLNGNLLSGSEALLQAGLESIELGPKEGLALINGTQFSTAFALVGLFESWRNANSAIITACLSTDAIMGSTQPLAPEIHELRGHRGQIEVAHCMRSLLEGSMIRESHRENDTRVQDPYCIRCQPQVVGSCIDILRMAAKTLEIEANAATDNPLVLPTADPGNNPTASNPTANNPTANNPTTNIVSGGNFHAEPVALAADQIALAIAEIGAIAQRRVALMVDPTLSYDLPAFLSPQPGLNSGYMIAEVTTAALMSENKHLANPCSTDSTPTSANQEDHVSMAAHAARRLIAMNNNLSSILGIELLCAAQGVEFRQPLTTSRPMQRVIALLREHIPTLKQDRYLHPELEKVRQLIQCGAVANAANKPLNM